jgi:DNA-binding CsgD family transcriptional regulator
MAALRQRRRRCADRGRLLAWPSGRAGERAAAPRETAPRWPAEMRGAGAHGVITLPALAQGASAWSAAVDEAGTGQFDGLHWLWHLLGHGPVARERWSDLLRLAVTSAERPVRAEMLNQIGQFARSSGDLTMAHGYFQEALVAGRASQNAESVVRSLDGLTDIAVVRGMFELARVLQDEALAIRRRLGDQAGVASSLAIIAWLGLETHGAEQSESLLEESLTVRVRLAYTGGQQPDIRSEQALGLVHLGWLTLLQGQRDHARTHLTEALAMVDGAPGYWQIVCLLTLLGQPAASETPARMAAQLLASAELLVAHTAPQTDRTDPFGYLCEARSRLTPAALALVWGDPADADGSKLIEHALWGADAGSGADPLAGCHPSDRHSLTPRELEVALLIGKGYTNRQIADELIIGERTAETHARNIREKLGLSTRSQVAAWAAVRATTRE